MYATKYNKNVQNENWMFIEDESFLLAERTCTSRSVSYRWNVVIVVNGY